MSAISSTASSPAANSKAAVKLAQPLVRAVGLADTAALAKNVSAAPATTASTDEPQLESVRVSSSIGRAASAGQLSRQEALDIYRQIASLL